MPTRLKADHRQILLNAGRNIKGKVSNVHAATGNSLERQGFGWYRYHDNRTFYLNNAGLAYVLQWEERNIPHDKA